MTSALKSAFPPSSSQIGQGYGGGEVEPMRFAGVIRYDARFPEGGVVTSGVFGALRVSLKNQLSADQMAAFRAKGLAEISFVGSRSFDRPTATANEILRFWMEPDAAQRPPQREAARQALEKIHQYYGVNPFDAKPLPPK